MPEIETTRVTCFGGPLNGQAYEIPTGETRLAVTRVRGGDLSPIPSGELIPLDQIRGEYKLAMAVDGKHYMLWEGWSE